MLSLIKRFFNRSNKVDRPPTVIDIALAKLKSLEPLDFKYCQSSNLSIFMLKVLVSPVDEYTKHLNFVVSSVKTESILYRDLLPNEVSTISIGDWFLKPNRTYLDEVEAAEKFFIAANEFLVTYKELINEINLSVTSQHNERVLRQTLQNVLELIDCLTLLRDEVSA